MAGSRQGRADGAQRGVVALILLSVALISAGFVPEDGALAAGLRLAAIVPILGALALVVRRSRRVDK